MTARQIAILNVSKLIALTILAGAVTSALLMFVPLPYIGIGVCVIVTLYLIYMIYELELSKAQYRESLDKLKKDLAD